METENASTTKRKRIHLTNRRPVSIVDAEWPLLVNVGYDEHRGGQVYDATREAHGFLRIREHADGRAIVYARRWNCSAVQGEQEWNDYAGELTTSPVDIEAIKRVHGGMTLHGDDYLDVWDGLIDRAISSLPPEVI